MPNRIIKESILTSPTIAPLSGDEERHFIRLLLLADDYGCLEVTNDVIRGRAYPKILDRVTEEDCEAWTITLVSAGLLITWVEGGRTWGSFPQFDKNSGSCFTDGGKRTRNRRKTPTPPNEFIDSCLQNSEPDGAKRSQMEPRSRFRSRSLS